MARRSSPRAPTLPRRLRDIVRFVRHTNEFGSVLRLIWRPGSPDGKAGQERNDSHTCQLIDVAWFIQQRWLKHLDLTKVLLYALVHDKLETYAGDTPAFLGKLGEYTSGHDRASKNERERLAQMRIDKEWGRIFPSFIEHLAAYQRQEDEESRFIYALDKFLSDLNIYEDNGRTNRVLGITLEEQIAYKRQRVAAHSFVLGLYEEFVEHCRSRPDLFHTQVGRILTAAE